jgi:hypothetical protein
VPARLLAQARLRFQDVAVRGPAVRGPAGNGAVPEMSCCSAAMPGGELELGGRLLVELCLGGETLVQFQTLTSR